MKSTIKQFVREWSVEGVAERQQSYDRIVDCLCQLFPDESKRRDIRVLNPGSGLGRLTWEIARKGFRSEGNEFSYFMLLGSHFILNCITEDTGPLKIAPFVHQTTNVICANDRIRQFSIPDIKPSTIQLSGSMAMTAGDFTEVYGHESAAFDAVVTCFFLDTAHNIMEYIEKISFMLKPGGYWINLGPLLYHYSDTQELSIEISLEEIRKIIPAFKLEITSWSFPIECQYVSNAQSMMQFVYQCAFFTCRKT